MEAVQLEFTSAKPSDVPVQITDPTQQTLKSAPVPKLPLSSVQRKRKKSIIKKAIIIIITKQKTGEKPTKLKSLFKKGPEKHLHRC